MIFRFPQVSGRITGTQRRMSRAVCGAAGLVVLAGALSTAFAQPLATVPSDVRVSHRFAWVGALQNRLAQCWVLPAGAREAGKTNVRISFELNADGMLAGRPRLLEVSPGPFGSDVGESAIRAIEKCQPYDFLPQAEYKGGWDKLDLTLTTDGMWRR
jgi:hypothetical protein